MSEGRGGRINKVLPFIFFSVVVRLFFPFCSFFCIFFSCLSLPLHSLHVCDSSHAHACTRMQYNNVHFLYLFLPNPFMIKKTCSTTSFFFSTLVKSFKKTSKKDPDIFGVYAKRAYFCTRFPREESLAKLT